MTTNTSETVASGSVSPSPPPMEPRRRSLRSRLAEFMEAYVLLVLLVVVVLFFSFYPPTAATFPSWANLQITLGSQAVVAMVAVGALAFWLAVPLAVAAAAFVGKAATAAKSTGLRVDFAARHIRAVAVRP